MTAVSLSYDVHGAADAPVLVLGGSLGTNRDMWQPQLAKVRRDFRVLRFDHRGHGRSPVPPGPYTIDDLGTDVLALLDRQGMERVSYCGLSLGGMVGIWLAAHAPERIERLGLLCTAAYLPPAQGWLDRAAQVRADGTGSIADAVLARWFTAPFRATQPGPMAAFRAMLSGTPAEGYAGCCEAIAAMDLRPVLARISAPTLVIAGADDPATPPALAEEIIDGIGDGRVAVVDHAAHLASAERPDVVGPLLLDHLTS
jgi:3-oxoadipate enol-lactonase